MTIDGDTLEIDLDIDIDDVVELKNFVADRLEYIETIVVNGENEIFTSSSLFALLHSIKISKPSISIPVIENDLSVGVYGTLHWVTNG